MDEARAACSSRIRPNAAWVDCSSPAGAAIAGTSATFHGRARFSRTIRARSISARAASALLPPSPAQGSHSSPSAMFMLSRSAAVWPGFINPA